MDVLSQVSWKYYNWTVAIIAALYYAYVIRRYYIAELQYLFSQVKYWLYNPALKGSQVRSLEEKEDSENEHVSPTNLENASDLTRRIHEFFSGISSTSPTKEDMQKYLRLLLKEYEELRHEPVRQAINQFILSECEKHCTVLLSEKDVERLWNKQ